MQTPTEIVRQYLECFEDTDEVKETLQEIIDLVLSSDEADDWTADERANRISFCKQTGKFIHAVKQLYKNQNYDKASETFKQGTSIQENLIHGIPGQKRMGIYADMRN